MIPVTAKTPILLAIEPVDFRKQLDGLVAYCRQAFDTNPMTSTLIVFINRRKTMIRVLTSDGNGMWMMTKRLSNGKYTHWPSEGKPLCSTSAKKLMHIIRSSRFEPLSDGKL